jgi:hypothetical protein
MLEEQTEEMERIENYRREQREQGRQNMLDNEVLYSNLN